MVAFVPVKSLCLVYEDFDLASSTIFTGPSLSGQDTQQQPLLKIDGGGVCHKDVADAPGGSEL